MHLFFEGTALCVRLCVPSASHAVPVPKTGVCCKCSICRALMEVVVFLSFLSSACVTLTLFALAPLPLPSPPACTGGERSDGPSRWFKASLVTISIQGPA